LRKALGSHAVPNAFFPLDFGSEEGIFGHTFADLMHVLEEGIFKYLLSVFLDPLSDTISGEVDDLVTKLFGPTANRCHGMWLFPRLNFTRGFTRLTLLSSEERVGALIVLVILLQTARGQEILLDRFSPDFDQRRKTRAAQFSGHQNNEDEEGENLTTRSTRRMESSKQMRTSMPASVPHQEGLLFLFPLGATFSMFARRFAAMICPFFSKTFSLFSPNGTFSNA
jgi:hypothetical protein